MFGLAMEDPSSLVRSFLLSVEAKTDYSSRRSQISRPREPSRSMTIWLCRAHNSIWRTWMINVCLSAFHKYRKPHDCSTDVFQNEMLFEVINATLHAAMSSTVLGARNANRIRRRT